MIYVLTHAKRGQPLDKAEESNTTFGATICIYTRSRLLLVILPIAF